MKNIFKITLAAGLALSAVTAVSAPAMAASKAKAAKECKVDVTPFIVGGAVLGAVTGGAGSVLAYGAAYVFGGAAIGAAGGATLGIIHADVAKKNCM